MAISKKAAIPGAGLLASHLAQNAIGRGVAKSKKFESSVAKSALTGALGRKSPRTVKSVATDMVAAVASPEANQIKNEAYSLARDRAKQHDIAGILGSLSKRDKVVARLAAAGDEKGLARIGRGKDKLVETIRDKAKTLGVPNVSKADQKAVLALPKGDRAPASIKAGIAANIAIAPLDPATAGLNAAKLATSSKLAQKSKMMQRMKNKFTVDPAKASYQAGREGKPLNKAKNLAQSLGVNPFAARATELANKAGRKSRVQTIIGSRGTDVTLNK